MGYELNALFGKTEALKQIQFPPEGVKLVELSQGFSLLPLHTHSYEGALDGDFEFTTVYFNDDELIHETQYGSLPERIYQSIAHTKNHKIALFYADYFGGIGQQYAIVWENGEVTQEFPMTWNRDVRSIHKMPINCALKLMGVVKVDDNIDLFDSVGLGRFRETSSWYEFAVKNSK